MTALTWLHLTDLHVGMKEHSWLLPGVEDRLFDDLKQLHQRTGPWDLVLFTGDLAQHAATRASSRRSTRSSAGCGA